MRKIRSGQAFLYRNAGYDSTVVEIRMKDKVTGSYLQAALTNTARRFPYLTEKLVEKGGSYYLHRDDNSMVAARTDKFRPIGSMATGYHLLDVTFFGNILRVAFHHGLCDGRGVKPFIETLLYEYVCLKYRKQFSSDGIRLVGEPIDEREFVEPYATEFYPVDESKIQPVEHDGYALPEATATPDACYRTELIVDESIFVNAAKAIHATPATFAAMLLSPCVLDLNPRADKPIICNMAMDLRSALGMEATHRNCVGSSYLPYALEDGQLSQAELAAKYRGLLNMQREPDAIKAGLNRQIGMFNKLDEMNTLEEKRQMLSFFNSMINNTYVLSYMGKLQFNDYDKYMESAHLFSDGIRGLTVNMVSAGGKLSFDVLQGFHDMRYIQAFQQALTPYGLLAVSDTIPIVTGKDKSYLTASYQAERYYVKPE